LLDSDSDILEL